MKKSYIVLVFLLVILSVYLYMSFKGTVWKEKEFIREVEAYLDQKYPIKMNLVTEPKYSFKSGTYSVLVSPEGMDYITFVTYQSASNKVEYADRFSYEFWTYEANNELKKVIDEANFQYNVTGVYCIIEVPNIAA